MNAVNYTPPGEVAAAFHQSDAFVRGILGPVGSGKSSTCCVEIVRRALAQKPHNGVRRSRWAVIRNTYPELKSTTIKTWETWIPQNVAPIKWDTPISCMLKVRDIGDGTSLELEVLFIALDKATDTGKLRSLELTGAWLNEASEIPKEIFDMATQRVGRFPSKIHGGPSWTGVILDTNPPDDDHWWFKFAEEETPKNWKFFRQPGGLYKDENGEFQPNPYAENISNLPNGHQYYLNQVAGKTEDWINVFLLANYGTTMDGKPVFPEWTDRTHVAKEKMQAIPGIPLVLGWDFGLTPACVIAQMTPKGQVIILDELVSEDMGIRQFANEVVRPHIMNNYPRFRLQGVGDPAGRNRAQTDEKTCYQELVEAGLPATPARTNDFLPRREAVAFFLTRMSGGEPGFILNPGCRTLRKGFNGGYRYERLKVAGERYRDRPCKDHFSHIHDALQYACLYLRGEQNPVRARAVQNVSAKGWT